MNEQSVKHVTEVFAAINEKRWDDVGAAYAEDAVIEYPQSGERVVGRSAIEAMMHAFPTPPVFVLRNAFAGDDNSVTVEFDAVYAGIDPWKGVALYWLADSGITREVAYFGEPFKAPEWRAGISS